MRTHCLLLSCISTMRNLSGYRTYQDLTKRLFRIFRSKQLQRQLDRLQAATPPGLTSSDSVSLSLGFAEEAGADGVVERHLGPAEDVIRNASEVLRDERKCFLAAKSGLRRLFLKNLAEPYG